MNECFETKELYFASVLYSLNIKLVQIKRLGKTCWFVFDNSEECHKIYDQFISKKLKVNAKAFEEAIRTLKDIVFAQN